ncbi:MAG: hypothetical protein ACPGVB_03195 [Chitinophagales bacterium]
MKKSILYFAIIIICCIFSSTANAQSAPGLVGKRLTFFYDFNAYYNSSAVDGPIDNGLDVENNWFNRIFAYKQILGADYALSRTLSVGIDGGYTNRRISDTRSLYYTTEYIQHHLSTREIGVRLKFFPAKKGGIAPIGFYNQVRIFRLWLKSEMRFEEKEFIDPSMLHIYEERGTFAVSYGFGRQGILFENIIYHLGYEIGIAIAPKDKEYNFIDDFISSSIFSANAFRLKAGLALPIF